MKGLDLMCGIMGIYGQGNVITELYDGMLGIQHRGQDAAGIITSNGEGRFHLKKGGGLIRDVIKPKHFRRLKGHMGLGHLRYPTVGGGSAEDAQPFYVNYPFGIAMIHNGNLTNFAELKKELMVKDSRHMTSNCDAEAILNVFASSLARQNARNLNFTYISHAVQEVFRRCKGAYSVVAIIANHGMVMFRDPYGVKPIIFGQKEVKGKKAFAVASESVSLDILGYNGARRDLMPGEVVYIDE
ncbi:amidophosphoribosyltransferase, partial [Candidatus Micrarchaeota archaeon]|nr:amidophosphoribosyltransferase [Candidatus Micrarchaeota archaeon]